MHFQIYSQGHLTGRETPYLDLWDHKGPLLYLVYVVGLAIDQTWGIWAVQGLFLLGSACLAFVLLRKAFGILPALFTLAMFLTYFSKFAPPGGFTEQFGLLFQFLTLYLFICSEEQGRPDHTQIRFPLLHICIGALGAASFLLRPNLVALWIALGIYWVIMGGTSFHRLIWAVAGGGAVLILTAAFFKSLGALGALWDAVFVYNLAYSEATLATKVVVIRHLTAQMIPISLLVIAGWCTGIVFLIQRLRQKKRLKGLIVISLILLPLEVVSLSLSEFAYPHYYFAALPVIMLLLAFIISFVLEQRLVTPLIMGVTLLLGAAYFTSPPSSVSHLAEKYDNAVAFPGANLSPQAVRHRDLIQRSTRPDESILVWGGAVWIYLYSDRDSSTRYFYGVPLSKPNYTTQSMYDEFLSNLKEKMPRLIIDTLSSGLPPLADVDRSEWRPSPRTLRDLEIFEPFFEFVEANYLAVNSTPPYKFYALKHSDNEAKAPLQGQLIIRSTYDIYLDGRTLTYVRRQCDNDDAAKRFILHVFPVDNSVIDGNELHTMDFSFIEGKDWYVGESCVVSRQLPDFAIAYIRTGQYDLTRSRHEWVSEYHFSRPN